MKRSELKLIVTEIIRRTFWEMSKRTATDATWSVDDELVTIEDIELPDGRMIGATVEVSGDWSDGAFDYEYGSIKGTHRYPLQFEPQNWNITSVWDMATNQPIQMDAEIKKAIDGEMSYISDKLPEEMEPPDWEGMAADRETDRRREREMGW